jgi:two-component system invasion response regulator UvrY
MLGSHRLGKAGKKAVDVLLVDSRRLVRAGVQRVLSDSGYLSVFGEAATFDEAIRLARSRSPQLVVVNMPSSAADVLEGIGKFQRQFPAARVLVLSDGSDLIIQERLLQAGVAGCVSSFCSVEEAFSAIDAVLSGERYISDSLARKLAERRLTGTPGTPFDQLNHRELQILLLVAEGRDASAIARELCLTRKTVNGYRNRLLEKLRVGTEVELMRLAARHGLVRIAESA